jgi:hypothetical protein
LAQTRDGTRERVTEVADNLAAEVDRLSQAHVAVSARLAEAELLIEQLRAENARLRNQLGL